MALIDNVGGPIRESLPTLVDALEKHGLRERVRVVASGKVVTPAAVAWALRAGADLVASARGFLFVLGRIQALRCNKNACPTGSTTHDPKLLRAPDPEDKARRVMRDQQKMEKEAGVIAQSCGVAEPRQLRRRHCRIVQANGCSVPLDELYPEMQSART